MCNSTGKRCARERLAALFVASLPAVNCQQQKRCSTFGQCYVLLRPVPPTLPFFLLPRVFLFRSFPSSPPPPRRRRRDGTLVYKTPTRTYSARICMQSISLGNRVTSAYREKEREVRKSFGKKILAIVRSLENTPERC